MRNSEGNIQGKPYRLWEKGTDIDSILSAEALEYIAYKIVVSSSSHRIHTPCTY
jgi:hypothetical protein